MNLLEVSNISKKFSLSGKMALKNISLKIAKGETLGLIGESGSGKSTLARCICRLIEPDSGTIFFNNDNVLQMNTPNLKALRKKMQIVFQDTSTSLNPQLTIQTILEEPLLIHKLFADGRDRLSHINETLNQVGLKTETLSRSPHQLSGGQRQRVVIARALLLNPELIICDEPVSSLDPSVRAQIINLLLDLQQKMGVSYLFISHDLSVIRNVSDRIAIINNGEIVESDLTHQIFSNPQNLYTKKLLQSI